MGWSRLQMAVVSHTFLAWPGATLGPLAADRCVPPPDPATRRDILNTYGHQHLLTLAALSQAGLLQRREGRRSAFPAAKQQLRLLLQEGEQIDEANPKVLGPGARACQRVAKVTAAALEAD